MTYHVHKTPGIILQSLPSKEANSFLIIFTKELGLIKATAQGSRHLKSKLRYGIQKYELAQLSFVYGKNTWRLINAVPISNIFYDFKDDRESMRVIAQTCSLLQRLLVGEEKNKELFDLVTSAITFLRKQTLSREDIQHFEFLFMLRILHNLGYVSGSAGLEILAVGSVWGEKQLEAISSYRREAVTAINRAIVESQL